MIELAMLITHRGGDAEDRTVVQGADQCFALVRNLWRGQLLRKPPNLAASSDWRIVVQVHRMRIIAFLHHAIAASETHRDHLAGLGVVSEAGRIWHANEFVGDGIARHLQRLGHHLPKGVDISAVSDHYVLAIVEFIWARRVCGVIERHGKCLIAYYSKSHLLLLLCF